MGESVAKPLAYYENNLGSLASLVRLMGDLGAKHIVFSSSATVYGAPERVPIPESARLAPANPYGWTKLLGEQLLRDVAAVGSVVEGHVAPLLQPGRRAPERPHRRGPARHAE